LNLIHDIIIQPLQSRQGKSGVVFLIAFVGSFASSLRFSADLNFSNQVLFTSTTHCHSH